MLWVDDGEVAACIRQAMPANFLQSVIEHVEASYQLAASVASRLTDRGARARLMGQGRFYIASDSVKRAALGAGLQAGHHSAPQHGERVVFASANGVVLGFRTLHMNKLCAQRRTKYNVYQALRNARLEPRNGWLFADQEDAPQQELPDGIFVQIVAIHPLKGQDSTVPFEVAIGAPYSGLNGWHFLQPLNSVIATYGLAPTVEVPDNAAVKLKERFLQKEQDQGNTQAG